MAIRPANEVSFSPPQRCPACGLGVVPYGRQEPFVVDASGRVYCRDHGSRIEPDYPAALDAYRKDRMAKRQAALRELAEMNQPEEHASSR